VALQNLMGSKYIAYFLDEVSDWQKKLSNADQVIQVWFEVQRTWMHLESIFIGSEDIRKQLPEDSKRFDHIDKQFRVLLEDMVKTLNVVKATNKVGLYEKLEELQKELTVCEKALAEYLETKRLAYPRFYFISSADLLDILSNGNQPELVTRHLTKLYDSISKLQFEQSGGKNTKNANAMWAKDGEFVKFDGICDCSGKVEVWLNRLTDTMRQTMRHYFGEAVVSYEDNPREKWIFDYPAQVSLCGTQIWWTTEVNIAFARLDEGYENAMKDYNRKQITQLNTLISLLLGDLTQEERQKIMTICTIDVHSRDVVAKLITAKVDNASAFQWQSQLRHRWDYKIQDCFCNICDAQFRYAYEYLGNTPRLVITPLTDRCYITLTQRNLRLYYPEKSAVAQHSIEKEHKILFDHTKVINKSSHYWDRTIKEAIEIKLEKNNFNRDSGLQLSQAWTPALDQLRPSYNQGHEDHGPRTATDSNRRNRARRPPNFTQESREGRSLRAMTIPGPGLADPPTNPVSPETA
ncbi:hypothetical protein ANN_24919, partial [Periplaneta americana]